MRTGAPACRGHRVSAGVVRRVLPTDMDGRFSILQVPVGTYNLVVSFVGFTSQTLFNVNVKSVGNPDFNFKLAPDIAGPSAGSSLPLTRMWSLAHLRLRYQPKRSLPLSWLPTLVEITMLCA